MALFSEYWKSTSAFKKIFNRDPKPNENAQELLQSRFMFAAICELQKSPENLTETECRRMAQAMMMIDDKLNFEHREINGFIRIFTAMQIILETNPQCQKPWAEEFETASD